MRCIKKFCLFSILALLCVSLGGCVTNNGDIGRLYGIWNLTEMRVDGEVYQGWRQDGYNDSFFQFQNNICFVSRTNDRFDVQNQACTWQWIENQTVIELDFSHTDDANPEPGGWPYAAPQWLLLTNPTKYSFEVKWDNDKRMIWNTVNTQGQKLTYYLSKNY